MKSAAHLFVGLVAVTAMTSCGLIQMPARLINTAIAPLTTNDEADENPSIALTATRTVVEDADASGAP